MNTFKIEKILVPNMTTLIFSGSLNEDFVQSDIEIPQDILVRLNLKDLISINSCGVRDLINFLRRFPDSTKVEFEHCPAFFIQQVNMVGGILNKMRTIRSFYVPYVEIETEEEISEFFETENLKIEDIPKILIKEGQSFEFDGPFDKFFRFLSMKY